MTQQQEQSEHGQHNAQWQAGPIKKYVEKQDVHDYRADERQAERGEAPAPQQEAAGNLKALYRVKIMAGEKGFHEVPRQFALWAAAAG